MPLLLLISANYKRITQAELLNNALILNIIALLMLLITRVFYQLLQYSISFIKDDETGNRDGH